MPINFINILQEYQVIIPIIQRGYAQGRDDTEVKQIREKFIEDLINFLKDNKKNEFILDFIYGVCNDDENDEEKKELYLLDGQQRLTTLFLLHWYILDFDDKEFELLKKFNYETRVSSSDFISFLLDKEKIKSLKERIKEKKEIKDKKNTKQEQSISNIIKEDKNFLIFWQSDPTVAGMLVVLDTIEKQIKELKLNIKNLKEKLNYIKFYNRDITNYDHEDLYVKMNSRGKPLTDFEIFKSKLYKILKEVNNSKYQKYIEKMDTTWANFIWNLVKDIKSESSKIEKYNETFYNLFLFLIEMLYKEQYDKKIDKYNASLFSLVAKNINTSDADTNIEENLDFIFKTIDFFISHKNIKDFFDNIFCYNVNNDKPLISTYYANINIFDKNNDNDLILNHINNYEIQHKIILFYFIKLLHLKKDNIDTISIDTISNEDKDKIRLIRNYVFSTACQNLENKMPIFNKIIENDDFEILKENEQDNDLLKKFKLHEKAKKDILDNPEKKYLREVIYKLENNIFLRGNISFILEDLEKYSNEDYQKIVQIINIIFSTDNGICMDNNKIFNRAIMKFITEKHVQEIKSINVSKLFKRYNNENILAEFIEQIKSVDNIIETINDIVCKFDDDSSMIYYLVKSNTIYGLSEHYTIYNYTIKHKIYYNVLDFKLKTHISTVLYNLKEKDKRFKDFNFYYYNKSHDEIINDYKNDDRILKYENDNIVFGYDWITLGKRIEDTNYLIAISTNNESVLEFGLRKINYYVETNINDKTIEEKVSAFLDKNNQEKDNVKYEIYDNECWYICKYKDDCKDNKNIKQIIIDEYEKLEELMSIFEK